MSLSSLFIIVLTTYIFLFLGVLICLTRVYFLAVFFSKDLRTHIKVIKLAGCAGSLSPGWRWGGAHIPPGIVHLPGALSRPQGLLVCPKVLRLYPWR